MRKWIGKTSNDIDKRNRWYIKFNKKIFFLLIVILLVAGGIGSIIGGITSKQTSSQKIKELTLEIVVNDILNPRYTLTLYKSDLSLKDNSPTVELIETWYRIFSVIINRNSNEARSV
jgi:hypothetical protein